MWEILQEKVYKTRITDLELSTTPLMNGCRNDDMIQLGPLRSQSLFQFVQINDTYDEITVRRVHFTSVTVSLCHCDEFPLTNSPCDEFTVPLTPENYTPKRIF